MCSEWIGGVLQSHPEKEVARSMEVQDDPCRRGIPFLDMKFKVQFEKKNL